MVLAVTVEKDGCIFSLTTGCGNFDGLQKSYSCSTGFKLNYYGTFTDITQSAHSNSHLNPFKLIIKEI